MCINTKHIFKLHAQSVSDILFDLSMKQRSEKKTAKKLNSGANGIVIVISRYNAII